METGHRARKAVCKSDSIVSEVLLASYMRFYRPTPMHQDAVAFLESGNGYAALEAAHCDGDHDEMMHDCASFILAGFAEILLGRDVFAKHSLDNALKIWNVMPRMAPEAQLPYSRTCLRKMVDILEKEDLSREQRLAEAGALMPAQFRPAGAHDLNARSTDTHMSASSPALGSSPYALDAPTSSQAEEDNTLTASDFATATDEAADHDKVMRISKGSHQSADSRHPMRSSATPESVRSTDEEMQSSQ